MKSQKYLNLDTPSNTSRISSLIRCHFSVISSTQSYLSNWVSKTPPPEFSTVSADVQTGGRGQYGREWEDFGGNVALSFVVYPKELQADQQFLLQMWSAICIYDTLIELGLKAERLRIKWPNDILMDGDKLAGILLQSSVSGSFIRHAVVGIGINVRTAPPNLPYVSCLHRQGVFISAAELREKILYNLYQSYQDMKFNRGVLAYLDIYHQRMWRYGEEVRFREKGELGHARILGLTKNGYLQIESREGIRVVTDSSMQFDRFFKNNG